MRLPTLFFAAVVVSCGSPDVCTRDLDCGGGSRCAAGSCVAPPRPGGGNGGNGGSGSSGGMAGGTQATAGGSGGGESGKGGAGGSGGGAAGGSAGGGGGRAGGAGGGSPTCQRNTLQPLGWARRNPTEFNNGSCQGGALYDCIFRLASSGGGPLNPFPNSGGFGTIVTETDNYLGLGFDTPDATTWAARAPAKTFQWDDAQEAADPSAFYITVSDCPGDFRIPPGGTAPATDPTFALGCRSIRPSIAGGALQPRSNLPYVIGTGPSNDTTCVLAPNRRYYFNFVRASAADGVITSPATEVSGCFPASFSSCGLQLQYD
ncbi:MAG: hypothetical protein JNK82_14885 [Myxococcaceae bacterium]|nr:hypothetical protein [Myxococcaceae bacterium]